MTSSFVHPASSQSGTQYQNSLAFDTHKVSGASQCHQQIPTSRTQDSWATSVHGSYHQTNSCYPHSLSSFDDLAGSTLYPQYTRTEDPYGGLERPAKRVFEIDPNNSFEVPSDNATSHPNGSPFYRGDPSEATFSPQSGLHDLHGFNLAQTSNPQCCGFEGGLFLPETLSQPRALPPGDPGPPPNSTPGAVSAQTEDQIEEPYAKLIYRALMSTPDHSMALQDIYRWVRTNTNKGNSDSKGWMNSIRHNLSMNAVSYYLR